MAFAYIFHSNFTLTFSIISNKFCSCENLTIAYPEKCGLISEFAFSLVIFADKYAERWRITNMDGKERPKERERTVYTDKIKMVYSKQLNVHFRRVLICYATLLSCGGRITIYDVSRKFISTVKSRTT